MNGGRLTSARGFTLVELLVVIVLIVTLSAMAVPTFESGLTGSRVRGKLTRISQMAALSASLAAQEARPYRLVFDTENQRVWIECEADPINAPDEFEPMQMSDTGLVDLGEDLRMTNIALNVDEDDEERSDAPPMIEFRRDGTSDGGIVVLETRSGDVYTFQIAPMTSRVRLLDYDLLKQREES